MGGANIYYGIGGISLVAAALHQATNDSRYRKIATRLINQIISGFMSANFVFGYVSIGCVEMVHSYPSYRLPPNSWEKTSIDGPVMKNIDNYP